jgi:hypothetical protein
MWLKFNKKIRHFKEAQILVFFLIRSVNGKYKQKGKLSMKWT